jgi:NAD(P)-dependent dehydrogenase (short-subunit alcohol dehydrogenase family)
MTVHIDLSGKAALVTGGSRGLGAEMCRQLAAAGAAVAVHYATGRDRAEKVAQEIRAGGGTAMVVGGDFPRTEDVQRVAAEAHSLLGDVSVLVNNVGREEMLGPALDLGWDAFQGSWELNVRSAYLLAQILVPGMRRAKYGRVINVLSMAAHGYPKNMAAYSTAKTAFAGFTRALAVDLGPDGITVNSVSPGWIPVERHGPGTLPGRMATAARTPLGHLGTPQDVAGAVLYLASPLAGFVTGVEIPVCGGSQLIG